jgi:multidrug efflux pump subunit AcrA (membrane-fusion protein)
MLWPVRLSVLAPAEVVSRQSVLITSPMDGIVKTFHVQPNEEVVADQLLVTLDQTSLANQYQIAQKSYQVVKAEYDTAQQRAFVDPQAREQIHLFQTQMAQKLAEAEYVQSLLDQTAITAPRSGVAIFKDENDWLGRPVVTGQKILKVASSQQVQLEVMLPVDDAITLDSSVEIAFFLNIAPTKPLHAQITHVGYEANSTPGGGLAFPLKATFNSLEHVPRIGLRGTAKIYGKKVVLIYAILRKPLTQLRQFLGV